MDELGPHDGNGTEGRPMVEDYQTRVEGDAWLAALPFLRDLRWMQPRGRCLEVGAGPAVMACMFAREHASVRLTALDISEEMALAGRERIRRQGLSARVDYLVGDAYREDLFGRLGEFDLVYTTMSMHHWPVPLTCLANLYSAVKKGGILYIGDLRRIWWLSWLGLNDNLFGSLSASCHPREINKMLKSIGAEKFIVHRLPPYIFHDIIVWK